ncbi:hypothetical protein N7456_001548 [Penicillium angulare]|uniref:Uncharacterized protein n=1 Tax=Penicillium angulare TaxID=116970 RepID=A0A9W9G6S2_9EURO|nr:hypothetical protein N7456_001548 [Penicillium angulare]
MDGALYPRSQRATLASIRETSLQPIDTLLNVQVEESTHHECPPTGLNNETDVQRLLNAFEIKPSTPARLNELQFQLFTDFVFTWRFHFDALSTLERSFALFATLAIGILRIAAWDFEVRNADTEELPILFHSLPSWKTPTGEVFWFHKYLVVCCNTDEIGSSVSKKTKEFASRRKSHTSATHGIAITIRHIALFEISDDNILISPPVPLVTNTSSLDCSPGFRILAYIFTLNGRRGHSANEREKWGATMPPELFDMILKVQTPKSLIAMAQASFRAEEWYYSSIPQMDGFKLRNLALSIPCCAQRDVMGVDGIYCSYVLVCIRTPLDTYVLIAKRQSLVQFLGLAAPTRPIVQSE